MIVFLDLLAMKISNCIKVYLILILICLISLEGISQNLTKKHERDSLKRVWQLRVDSIATVNRIAFFKLLESMPSDTDGRINMNGLQLGNFPDLSYLNNISAIDAERNNFKRVPAKLFMTDSLDRLNLSNNDMRKICFPRNTKIKNLVLSGNNFRRLPRSVKKLKNLSSLTISDNQIKRIPRFLKKMPNLKSLEINFNKIKLTRADIRRLKNIEVLVMAGNKITELPRNINELENVKKLNFSKNKLSSVPPAFALLDSLEVVSFYKNDFNHIPLEITLLNKLRIIDFYYNSITSIPNETGNLQNLTKIFLSYNKIEKLPDTLRSLQKLKELYVHDNQIRGIPDWITELENLEIIDISYNKLFSIPDMSNMTSLYEVDIQENHIDYVPWKLIDKPNLRLLLIRGNPFLLDDDDQNELMIKLDKRRSEGVVIVD